jgi:hypothetical protein
MTARHWQWRVCFLYIQNVQRLSISLVRGLNETHHWQWRVSLFFLNAPLAVAHFVHATGSDALPFVNAPLTVARCHSYIWNFTIITLIFNNINLIIIIINKNCMIRKAQLCSDDTSLIPSLVSDCQSQTRGTLMQTKATSKPFANTGRPSTQQSLRTLRSKVQIQIQLQIVLADLISHRGPRA